LIAAYSLIPYKTPWLMLNFVVPLALIAGSIRGIPFYWRLIDCSFGVAGAALLWPCRRAIQALEARSTASA
jgi:hypothetical protein